MDAEVARVAGRQHSLVLREQALACGLTDRMIHRRGTTGRWVLVAPGLYRIAGVPVTWHQRALAACLVSGSGAVVSHRAAAVVWGVSGFRPGPLDITVPLGRSGRNTLARVHRSTVEGVRREGIPVTPPSRLVLDLAGAVSGDALEEAVDDVLCRRLCRLDELDGGRSRALRAVLEAWAGDGLPDGAAEMRVVRRLLAAGLP